MAMKECGDPIEILQNHVAMADEYAKKLENDNEDPAPFPKVEEVTVTIPSKTGCRQTITSALGSSLKPGFQVTERDE